MCISYEEFLDFLKRMDCQQQFDRAFYLQNGGNIMDERLWNILDPDECFFNVTLNWSKTEEGKEYWRRIDELWYNERAGKE